MNSSFYSILKRLPQEARTVTMDAAKVSLTLFKVMIPVIIAVKILKEFGLIEYLAIPFAPVMEIMGLPAQTGLIWVTGMAVNIYSALIVWISLVPDMGMLTVAQATVLGTMMLIAHSLPVELKIAQECGVAFWPQFFLRVLSGLLAGFLLHLIFASGNFLQETSTIIMAAKAEPVGLLAWARGELINLVWVFCIILALMAMMRILDWLGITRFCIRVLSPVLRLIGIGENAGSITIVGLILGISYGSGLILHEIRKGHVGQKDLFASLSLMGLAHALIEDTLLLAALGSSMIGTFWFRLLFSLVVIALLTRWYAYFMRSRQNGTATP